MLKPSQRGMKQKKGFDLQVKALKYILKFV